MARKPSSPEPDEIPGDDDSTAATSVVRISTDLHNVLRVIAAVERVPLRKLLDRVCSKHAVEWCNKNKMNLGYKPPTD